MTSDKPKERKSYKMVFDFQTKDFYEEFLVLMKERNLHNKTEAIRYCITETMNSAHIKIEEELVQAVQKALKSNQIKVKYGMFSVNAFLNRAISSFLEKVKDDRESLKDWNYRKENLSDDENAIASAILTIQALDVNGATLKKIVKEVKIDLNGIKSILNNFVDKEIVSTRTIAGEEFYYSP